MVGCAQHSSDLICRAIFFAKVLSTLIRGWVCIGKFISFVFNLLNDNGNFMKGVQKEDFNWDRYLDETKSDAAPNHLFRQVRQGDFMILNGN